MTKKHKTFGGAQESVRKDIERAFGVLISRWHILGNPCMFFDREKVKKLMMVAIIMHNMIVELGRDGYESELFEEGKKAIERGMFIAENGDEKQFKWYTKDVLFQSQSVRDMDWEKHLATRFNELTDQLEHFSPNNDFY